MSMSVEEAIESLAGIDLSGDLGCEIYLASTDYNGQCGKPSVARIAYTCQGCGWHNKIFICEECLADFKEDAVMCLWCTDDLADWHLI